MFDKKAYYEYSKTLEIISIVKLSLLIIIYGVIGFFIGEYIIKNAIIGIVAGIIISIIIQFPIYLKEQIKVEEMRMNLEIYNKKENF